MRPALSRLPAVLAALLLSSLAACGTADQPELLNELASRLDRSGDLTYTAEYRLGNGAVAVVAQSQEPRRAAYVHPGGKSVATETELATCRVGASGARCTLNTPPSANTDPALDLLATSAAEGLASTSAAPGAAGAAPGLVGPSEALRLLSTAVLDGATVTRYENTIAGEPATCVGVHGSGGFTACITARGVLGSFTGTVYGNLVAFELTRFSTTVDAETFALPPGAAIDDRRPR